MELITLCHSKLTSNYTLHNKLPKCTIGTLNYKSCYTLHPAINSIIILDGKPNFVVQSLIESIV